MPARKPRCYWVLAVERGAKPGILARLLADVIVTEQQPGRWRPAKNRTGKHLAIRP